MTRRGRNLLAALPLLTSIGLFACGGSEPPPAPPPPPPPPPETASVAPPPPPAPTEPAPPPAPALPDIVFGPATPSDAPAKAPKVTIASPAKEQSLAADKAKDTPVKLNLKNWDPQVGGPHIHVVLDNHPYKPVYDLKAPLKLGDLLPDGDTLGEGEHLLVAFPGRMNHESVKSKDALAMTHFWVGKKGKTEWKATDPMLIYSRPKGTYNASKADHVLVDFYLSNVELGDGKDSVKATVWGPGLEDAGRSVKITEWKPYALDNLRNGEYKVALELDDKDGKQVPGAWNSTTRTITINRDAPEDPAPAPPPAPADKEKDKGDKDKDKSKKDDKGAEHGHGMMGHGPADHAADAKPKDSKETKEKEPKK